MVEKTLEQVFDEIAIATENLKDVLIKETSPFFTPILEFLNRLIGIISE